MSEFAVAEARRLASYEGWLDDRLKSATFRQAEIVSYSTATRLATIQLGGDTTSIAGVPHLASYAQPDPADTGVWVAMIGTSPMLIGAVGAGADSHAQGVLALAQITSNSSSTSGTTPLDVVTAAAVTPSAATRWIKLTADWRSIAGTVASDVFLVQIKEGSTVLKEHVVLIDAVAVGVFPGTIVHVLNPTAAAHTYKLTLVRTAGTGTAAMQAAATFPAQLVVEDAGTTA